MTESYFQYGANNPEGNEGCSLLVWRISSTLQKAEQRQSLPPPLPSKQKLWFTWGDHIKPEQRHASGMYLTIPLRDTRETTSHCVVSALSNNLHPLLKHPTLPGAAGWPALRILLTPCSTSPGEVIWHQPPSPHRSQTQTLPPNPNTASSRWVFWQTGLEADKSSSSPKAWGLPPSSEGPQNQPHWKYPWSPLLVTWITTT